MYGDAAIRPTTSQRQEKREGRNGKKRTEKTKEEATPQYHQAESSFVFFFCCTNASSLPETPGSLIALVVYGLVAERSAN